GSWRSRGVRFPKPSRESKERAGRDVLLPSSDPPQSTRGQGYTASRPNADLQGSATPPKSPSLAERSTPLPRSDLVQIGESPNYPAYPQPRGSPARRWAFGFPVPAGTVAQPCHIEPARRRRSRDC